MIKCTEKVFEAVDGHERELMGVTVGDISTALETAANQDRVFAASAEIVVDRAVDQAKPHSNIPSHNLLGWVNIKPHRGYTFVRYHIKGDVGQIEKIGVNEYIRGLGLARRMLEELMRAEPQVKTWNTTSKRTDGVRLFDYMRALYPDQGWETGGLDPYRP